jgi:hypothetical protein
VTDARYPALFDLAYEHSSETNLNQRKRGARRIANRALALLRSGGSDEGIEEFAKAARGSLGQRGTQAMMRSVREFRGRMPARPVWRLDHRPCIAIITGKETTWQADQLYSALSSFGADVWFYRRSIRVGRRIRCEDERALTEADYVVLLVSRTALRSNYVGYELDIVHWLEMSDRRERLLPIIADDLQFSDLPPLLGPLLVLSLPELGINGVVTEIVARIDEDRKKGGNARA